MGSFKKYINIFLHLKQKQDPWALLNALKIVVDSKKYLFDPRIQNHLDLSAEYNNSWANKLLVRDEVVDPLKSPLLRVATQAEIDRSHIFVIGGIYGDDPKQISALLKAAKVLNTKYGDSSEEFLPLAIFPEVSRQERYEAAVQYSLNPQFFPLYIETRVKNYLLPKLLDDLDLMHSQEKLSLLSFSMGGREIMMMQNALHHLLSQEFFLSEKAINSTMKKVNSVCLGYAPNLDAFEDVGFNKIVIFSIDDRGVLIHDDLYEFLFSEESVSNTSLFIHQMHKGPDNSTQYMVITGANLIESSVLDYKDHTIPYYLDCIDSVPEIQEILGDYIASCGMEE